MVTSRWHSFSAGRSWSIKALRRVRRWGVRVYEGEMEMSSKSKTLRLIHLIKVKESRVHVVCIISNPQKTFDLNGLCSFYWGCRHFNVINYSVAVDWSRWIIPCARQGWSDSSQASHLKLEPQQEHAGPWDDIFSPRCSGETKTFSYKNLYVSDGRTLVWVSTYPYSHEYRLHIDYSHEVIILFNEYMCYFHIF